jgi:hypothetical protein
LTVKELVKMLFGSVAVVAAGVEALALSTAVTLGVPDVRLVARQVSVVLLGAATFGVQVKPMPVSPAKLENV